MSATPTSNTRPSTNGLPGTSPWVSRPRGIYGVIAVNVVFGSLSLISAATTLTTGVPVPDPAGLGFLQPLAPVFPAVEVLLGTFFMVISYGLFHLRRWAWTATIAFELLHLAADVGWVASRNLALDKYVGLATIIAVLCYLTRPAIRRYFAGSRPAALRHS